MAGEFESKIVVISGGSRGIGRGIALAFARVGAQTVIASSSQSNLAAAAKAIAAEGTAPLAVAGDLRTLEGCQRLFARVNETYRHCDVLINNAGATRAGGFLDLPDEVWLDGFALKFFGCVRLTRLFWPLLKAARGSLVNIVVGAGRTPDAEFLIGGSVNAALLSFTKAMADVGIRDGVQVNAINPGAVRTDRFQKRLEAVARERVGCVRDARRPVASRSCAPKR